VTRPSAAPAPGQPTAERVQGIFSLIADKYDLFNILSSFGIDRSWRRAAVRAANLKTSSRVLDLCAGTGDLSLALARQGRPAEVVGTDFVPEMLAVAEQKARGFGGRTKISFSVADAQDLPFPDSSFDVATVAFGVRNLPDRTANFAEVMRVLKPGGRYVILEFSRPSFAPWRWFYHLYLRLCDPGHRRAAHARPCFLRLPQRLDPIVPRTGRTLRRASRRRLHRHLVGRPHRRHRRHPRSSQVAVVRAG
jgi:demethylmenaquinone methyltransferase / 2-methoxy-6-polyprenyl-1,4-benzoquinol methylase